MKVKRNRIIDFCNDYLNTKEFKDYCHNGLQVEGKEEVQKIVVGVSLSQMLIQKSISREADMIIVHHGLFKNQVGDTPRIRGFLRDRLKLILENDINLCGYHLPLDAHPEIGNSISLIKKLGLKKTAEINVVNLGNVGYVGETKKDITVNEFVELVNKKLKTTSYLIAKGPKYVKRVGVISGGASNYYLQALAEGIDTYICGAIEENIVREIEEVGINYINAGHYNTEVFGVQNLGKLISKKFKIPVEYINIPCDI